METKEFEVMIPVQGYFLKTVKAKTKKEAKFIAMISTIEISELVDWSVSDKDVIITEWKD